MYNEYKEVDAMEANQGMAAYEHKNKTCTIETQALIDEIDDLILANLTALIALAE